MSKEISDRAKKLHFETLVVDTHCDTLLACYSKKRTLAERSSEGHLDIPRLREGGVNCQFFACYIEPHFKPDRGLKRACQLIDCFYREIEGSGGAATHVTNYDEIINAHSDGKVAAVLAIEGGECLDTDVSNVRILKRLGVMAIGLTWNERNMIADGVGEERTRGGLTNFGVQVVQEMNKTGIIVDVSHLSEAGFWDVIEVSDKPIIASHSNAKAVCNHRRNLSDEQIRALARNGGVMGMNYAPSFVAETDADLSAVIRHIEHICALVGPDHVGLGSDYDGIGRPPRGLEDVTCAPVVTEALLGLGYSDETVVKILGANFLRIIKAVVG